MEHYTSLISTDGAILTSELALTAAELKECLLRAQNSEVLKKLFHGGAENGWYSNQLPLWYCPKLKGL